MSARHAILLGTSSQVPTRCRNHNSVYLHWDDVGLVFDPGEGTQRQMTLHGVKASRVRHLCITHFHGDHCLGTPGVIQRMALDGVTEPVHAHFPASGRAYWDRLRHASIFDDEGLDVRPRPIEASGPIFQDHRFTLVARPLDHRVETYGYRLIEPDSVTMLPERLDAAGLRGADIGRLQRQGEVVAPSGQTVHLADVSTPRPGQVVAFVMDTRLCDEAIALAEGADLVIAESTFLRADADLARRYGHMTAHDAATLAREAGARKLVLTHFSQRHPDSIPFLEEAARVFDDVVAAEDGTRVEVPPRS